jgi:glutamate/tyrosine decarboxylase-like PLP-dependent enzyme
MHLDAALFGGYLPFTSFAKEVAFNNGSGDSGRYDSIAVSCHKFFGFPSPAGLFITTQKRYDEFDKLFSKIHNPEYIHQVPGTITCSRDAVKPAEFFYFTSPAAVAAQKRDAKLMLDNTTYLMDRMQADCPQLMPVRANPQSNTVYFRHPGEKIVNKYSLATMDMLIEQKFDQACSRYRHAACQHPCY